MQRLAQTTMAAPRPSSDNSTSICGHDKLPAARTAASPFDDPKADLIIRSSDNILFYVHKSLLSIVSPVFEAMFALPHDTSQELHNNRPCVPVSDDSHHLFCLLSQCDPRCQRLSPTLGNLAMTLAIADKYDIDFMVARARKDLLAHDSVESEPLVAFAIAVRFRLDELAQKAAQETLRSSLPACPNSPHLKHISAFALHNLNNYHSKCKRAVRVLLASEDWAKDMEAAANYLLSGREAKGRPHTHGAEYFSVTRSLVSDGALWHPARRTAPWWSDYVNLMIYKLNDFPGYSISVTARVRQKISLEDCDQCKKYGGERLDTVSRILNKQVSEALSKVCKR